MACAHFDPLYCLTDPMGGRSFKCLRAFYNAWHIMHKSSDLVMAFFDWLDWGPGRNLILKNLPYCRRDVFRGYVKYNETEKEEYRVEIEAQTKAVADTNEEETVLTLVFAESGLPVPAGNWSFVWDTDRELYLVEDKKKYVHPNGGSWKWGHMTING